MRKRIISLFATIAAIAAACISCQDKPSPEEKPVIPESYLELVRAYRAGKEYTGTTSLSSFSKVFFSDGSYVIVKKTDFDIQDCSGCSPCTVTYDGASGNWLVDGTDSGIARTNGTLEESMPVYSFFDAEHLLVYAANAETMDFPNVNYNPDPVGPVDPVDPVKEYKIPVIHIDTEGKAPIVSKDDYVNGTIKVEDPCAYFSDVKEFEAPMKIKGRGNSTWGMPKKPYKIKLEEKAPILGIAKDKEWVLLANYSDKSLLRNATAMEISRILGFSWTPTMISVELYLNGKYEGVYTFTEHKKVSKNRVNIDTENDSFYIEIENEDVDEPFWFKTSRYNVTMMVHEPETTTPEQQAMLKQYLEDMETSFAKIGHESDADWINYRDYINFQSFVNYYLIQEITRNPDGNIRKSTFLTKEKDKPIEFYHVWDFDLTMGNCDYWGGTDPTGWQMKDVTWYNRLFKDKEFVKAVQETLDKHYDELYDVQNYIYDQAKLLEGAVDRNFERWDILDQIVWPNIVALGTYEEEVDFFVDYYLKRLEWVKKEIDKL